MVIEIRNIYKTFANSYSDFTLNIPNIRFQTGLVTFLMGHNGSGKSVFLKIISGEYQNDKNNLEIFIGEKQVKKIGLGRILRQKASENIALELTVKENFIIHYKTKKFIEKLFPSTYLNNSLSKMLSSNKFFIQKANQPVKELSGGQQQSLAFFITATSKSKLFLLDEFLSATDLATTNDLLKESRKYAKENDASVVIVSHDIDIALENADKILFFSDGEYVREMDNKNENWNKKYLKSILRK